MFNSIGNPLLTVVTEATVGQLSQQLMQALQYVHARNIIHRDVKAENILLAGNPLKTGVWHIKLIDFGIAARVENPTSTSSLPNENSVLDELVCGTPYYCAPEVWYHDFGPKVDVWAAGVVLYLALHGTFPFVATDPSKLEKLICDFEKQPSFIPAAGPRECPGYAASPEAQACLRALLTKDPAQRPSATRALHEQSWLNPARMRMMPDIYVPIPIRLRAGRVAARPPVDEKLEDHRTKTLQQMRDRCRQEREARRQRGEANPQKSQGSRETGDTIREYTHDSESRYEQEAGSDVGLQSARTVEDPYFSDSEIEEKPVMCLQRCPGAGFSH